MNKGRGTEGRGKENGQIWRGRRLNEGEGTERRGKEKVQRGGGRKRDRYGGRRLNEGRVNSMHGDVQTSSI